MYLVFFLSIGLDQFHAENFLGGNSQMGHSILWLFKYHHHEQMKKLSFHSALSPLGGMARMEMFFSPSARLHGKTKLHQSLCSFFIDTGESAGTFHCVSPKSYHDAMMTI